jgi:hypothetical protein
LCRHDFATIAEYTWLLNIPEVENAALVSYSGEYTG